MKPFVLQALGHQADNDVVGHELAGVHVGLGLLAQRRAGFDGRTQHVPRRDVRRGELFNQLGRLRALPGTRRPQQHDVHE